MEARDFGLVDLDPAQIVPLPAFIKEREAAGHSEWAVRNQVRLRDSNGLRERGAIIKRGGRLFVHRTRYAAWLMEGDA